MNRRRATLWVLLGAACGGEDASDCTLSILTINDDEHVATLSNGADVSAPLPGIQVDVRLEAIGLADGTPVTLTVEGPGGSAPVTEPVQKAQASFPAVDLGSADGAVELVPSLPEGQRCAISTRTVVLQTVRCQITAPAAGAVLNGLDDQDAATPALQTRLLLATNAPDGSTVTVAVGGFPASGPATVFGLTATFEQATLPDGEDILIEALVTTQDGSQATCSTMVDVNLGFDSCVIAVPAAEQFGSLGLVLNGQDDLDPTAADLQTTVQVSTDAPSGSTADLFANEQLLQTADFDALGQATFASQTLPEGPLVLRATCRDTAGNELRSPPFQVTVDSVPPAPVADLLCAVFDRRTAVLRCQWTAPVEAGTGLASYDLRYLGGGVNIDASNFATAAVATPAVIPVPSGAQQTYDLSSDADNLIRIGSTYDMAVVALDAVGNTSALSNDAPSLTPTFNVQSLDGEDANGYFGASAAAGDFNCDGIGDLAVGAPDTTLGSVARPNRVYLYFGGPQGLPAYYDTRILSSQASNFGGALTTLGNFDGDTLGPAGGCDDLAIAGNFVQKVYVYLGRPAWFDRTDEDVGIGADLFLAGDYAGWSGKLSGGDFNGDGLGDLVFGVADPTFVSMAVHVLLGFAATPMAPGVSPAILSATADADLVIGPVDNATFGGYVSSSDTDGDGFDEVLIGAYGYDVTPGDNVGAAYVVYGTALPPPVIDVSAPSLGFTLITGGPNNFEFGWAVNGVGDLDGDGGNEVAVGDKDYSSPATSAGIAYVFTGLAPGVEQTAGDAVWTVRNSLAASAQNDLLGRALVEGGVRLDDPQVDVDQDGRSDLIVAETEHGAERGSVLIFFGGPAGPAGDTNQLFDIRLPAASDASSSFGTSLVAVGTPDFNQDGFADFAVTDATYAGTGTLGRLTVFW